MRQESLKYFLQYSKIIWLCFEVGFVCKTRCVCAIIVIKGLATTQSLIPAMSAYINWHQWSSRSSALVCHKLCRRFRRCQHIAVLLVPADSSALIWTIVLGHWTAAFAHLKEQTDNEPIFINAIWIWSLRYSIMWVELCADCEADWNKDITICAEAFASKPWFCLANQDRRFTNAYLQYLYEVQTEHYLKWFVPSLYL